MAVSSAAVYASTGSFATCSTQISSRNTPFHRTSVSRPLGLRLCLPGQGRRGFKVQRRRCCAGCKGVAFVTAGWFGGSDKDKREEDKAEGEEKSSEEEEQEQQKKKYSKLAVAVVVDTIGLLVDGNFLHLDFGWAPVAAFVIQRMYRSPMLSAVGLVEQTIPGIKYLPTATLGWMVESVPQLEWATRWLRRLPFMGALGRPNGKGPFRWPFGGNKE